MKPNAFPYVEEIANPRELKSWIFRIQQSVSRGELEQFWPQRFIGDSLESIDSLDPDGVTPDVIAMYFRDAATAREYALSVETYHGRGGAWEMTSRTSGMEALEDIVCARDWSEHPYVALTRLFRTASADVRRRIVAEWPFGRTWTYPSQHRTTANEMFSPLECIRANLMYYAIDPDPIRVDWRDVLMNLAFEWHSARVADLDGDSLIAEAATYCEPDVAKLLVSFAERPHDTKTLEDFGLVEMQLPNGDREIRRKNAS